MSNESDCAVALVRGDPAEADVDILVAIFNAAFVTVESTELCVGADEPLYLPACETGGLAQVVSRLDYFSSALHEISHWCIAGVKRRGLIDFGYWYEPDGRSEEKQREFEKVEIKPQALEWLMTEACALRFGLSVDNTAQPDVGASHEFKSAVALQARDYLRKGLPDRASLFIERLLAHYRPQHLVMDETVFSVDRLS
jgi:elongation factor P hydroxylase